MTPTRDEETNDKRAAMLPHPYYPLDVQLPYYVANDMSVPALIGILLGWGLFIIVLSNYIIAFLWPTASRRERYTSVWFVLCGCLHMIFEGYLVRHYKELPSQQTVLAQLWKEYSLSDSRYLTHDTKVLCLEFITVFVWGPMALLTAFWTASRDPRRLVLQTVVNVAHIYGCTLYYATSLVELRTGGIMHSRPEAQYFWIYFIGFNAPFIVVPLFLLYQALGEAQDIEARVRKRL